MLRNFYKLHRPIVERQAADDLVSQEFGALINYKFKSARHCGAECVQQERLKEMLR